MIGKNYCNYVKRLIPDITFSPLNERRIQEENTKAIFNLHTSSKRNLKNKFLKFTKRKNGKCFLCGKYGHYLRDCYKNKRNKNNKKNYNHKFHTNKRKVSINDNKNKMNINNKHVYPINNVDHYKDEYSEDFTKDYNSDNALEINNIETIKNNININNNNQINYTNNNFIIWILDSGASISTTNDINLLTNIKKCHTKISLANDKEILSNYIGDFVGFINNQKFTLKNVFYSKYIKRNLISVNQLITQNYKIVFNNYNNLPQALIYDNHGNRIYKSISDNKNTFKIFTSIHQIKLRKEHINYNNEINNIYLNKDQLMDLWHRRLGHFDISKIRTKLNNFNIKNKCSVCINSKLKNKSYKPSMNKSTHILDLIHIDLVGPVTPSINNNKYFLTILDDFSRFGWVIFTENKNDIFNKFIIWYNQLYNTTNTTVKCIRSDNGKEFQNTRFETFCQENGIHHQFTIPYNPSQNGRAERFNGTLISSAKALLNEAKLSHDFWEFAVDTANFIHNRLPHQGIQNKIPFEIFYNKSVDYSIFRVFGCRVYFYVPKELRSKFDNNSHPGIFLGYSTNTTGYKVLDIINNRIILARSVEFMENEPGNSLFHHIHPNDEFRESSYTKYLNPYNSNIQTNKNSKTSENNFENNIKLNSKQYINNKNTSKNKNRNNNKYSKNNTNNININKNIAISNNSTNIIDTNSNKEQININDNDYPSNSENINNDQNISKINYNNNKSINNQQEINNINNKYNTNKQKYLDNNSKRKINVPPIKSNKRKKINNTEVFETKSNNNNLIEPYNYKDVFKSKDKTEWLNAVKEELNNMEKLKVFNIVKTVPSESNIISSRWVFKYKRDANGKIIKRKARLVAKGYTQEYGIDYKETFAPTLKQDTIRIITTIAVEKNFEIKQIDINSAYLNAPLKEKIYMKAPEGHHSHGKFFWKLNKALYGLKQAGKEWNDKLNIELIKIGFKRLKSEPCVYIKINKKKEIVCILSVYVDDILIAGTTEEINGVKESIKRKFNIKDIGNVEFVIGIKFNKIKDGYILHQGRYLNDILNKFNTNNLTFSKNLIPIENTNLKNKKFEETKYRSAIGSLLYLAVCTRPDILYAVSKAARKSKEPNLEDWENVLKIFRYLKYTKNYGIKIQKGINLKTFVDADFAGDQNTRKSTSGFLMLMGNTPTSWFSKLQHCVSTSTAEAEYYSLSECAKHALWYKHFLNELNIDIGSVTIFVDNKATIYNSINQSINPKSKHIDIRYHHIRDLVSKKLIQLKYIKSKDNLADGFTKYLNNTSMKNFRNALLTEI